MKKNNLHYLFILCLLLGGCSFQQNVEKEVVNLLQSEIMTKGEKALYIEPVTITSFPAVRSMGTINDFYSEGDYWWPDPENPDGPYIRKDGQTNPDNFVAHRCAMIRFSIVMADLTSSFLLTNDSRYVTQAIKHLNAWFISPETRMNPNLLYAQAIKGVATGRGIGIIDTIHLMEVVQSLIRLEEKNMIPEAVSREARKWFQEYLEWLMTHSYGITEMNAKNNHGTCWVMQVALFAKYTENKELLDFCKERYKNVLLPAQMAEDGSFPLELSRTKPYGYSLFNLDAMATICHILSQENDDLWSYTTTDGKNMQKAMEWYYPYIRDKSIWPYEKDVMYWDEWPVAQPSLLFSVYAGYNTEYMDLWKQLPHYPTNEEVIRNLPVRHPLLWIK